MTLKGVWKMPIFWSELGSGFGEPGGIPPPRQGYALRKIEGSPVLWTCEIQCAQLMISMKKQTFSSLPRTKVRRHGPPGSVRAQPCKNSYYYHYTRPNDKLPCLKRPFSRAKRQIAICKWYLQPATWFHVKQSFLMKYICAIWPW